MTSALMGIDDLAGVLVQCFALIFLGYVSGRVGLISEVESKGLSNFVSYFSLPALIFTSIATTNLSDICWTFVSGIFIAKTLIFVLVAGITMLLTRPFSNTASAGLYAIFCTQSNDFAVGYPIISSLYAKTHPTFANYLYVLAPIQLVILNPVGIFMMEIFKAGNRQSTSGRSPNLILPVLKGILTNPVILMTLLGLIWNVTLSHSIPVIIESALKSMSQAFSATALFLLGLSMVGKFQLFTGSGALLLPLILVTVKILVLPLVSWFTLQYATNDSTAGSMANFGFLYSTFPPAPTVFIFALQYKLPTDAVATGMVLGTILSAPVLFVSSNVIRLAEMSPGEAPLDDLATTMMYVSVISVPCCVWTLSLFILGKKWKSVTHRCTMALIVFQLCNSIGGFLWNFIDTKNPMQASPVAYKIHFILSIGGTFSSRIWTGMLALTLSILHWKSLCYVIKFRNLMNVITSLSTLAIFIVVIFFFKPEAKYLNPNFELGSTQAYVAVALLLPSLIMTLTGILITSNFQSKTSHLESIAVNARSEEENELLVTSFRREPPTTPKSRLVPRNSRPRTMSKISCREIEIEDLHAELRDHCMNEDGSACCDDVSMCSERVRQYKSEARRLSMTARAPSETSPLVDVGLGDVLEVEEETSLSSFEYHQVMGHLMLLLILSFSMFLGLVVSVGKMMTEVSTGAFLEIEYLDILMNYGQGIITFVIFGFDASSIVEHFNWLFRGKNGLFKLRLPSSDDLSCETRTIDEQFRTYHLKKCSEEITFELTIQSVRFRVFRGYEMVDWLVNAGLAGDRKHAVFYGRHLIKARTIEHFNQEQNFHDSPYFYRFTSDSPESALSSLSTIQSASESRQLE